MASIARWRSFSTSNVYHWTTSRILLKIRVVTRGCRTGRATNAQSVASAKHSPDQTILSQDTETFTMSPTDWKIIQTHSAGDLCFYNEKTGEESWYTPPGMTVNEIYEIPGAQQYFKTKEQVAAYVTEMAAEKAKVEKSKAAKK